MQNESCRRYKVRQVVLTDRGVTFPRGIDPFWADLPHALMPATIAAQLAYLESASFNADTILVGADCILGRDPRPVFDGTFDLGVTTHPFHDCILNTGAIFVPLYAKPLVARFWREALARCGEVWGDDQLSLAAAIRPTLKHGIEMRDDVRVAFFPAETHNWAPDDVKQRIAPFVIHFRGGRKKYMRRYFEQWCK